MSSLKYIMEYTAMLVRGNDSLKAISHQGDKLYTIDMKATPNGDPSYCVAGASRDVICVIYHEHVVLYDAKNGQEIRSLATPMKMLHLVRQVGEIF